MGQRLNIEFQADGHPLANAYYHWSGYTPSALDLLETIMFNIDNFKHLDDRLQAIRLLEKTGAGVNEEDNKYLNTQYSGEVFRSVKDRNAGILAVQEKTMQATRDWQEEGIVIDSPHQTIYFGVLGFYSKEEFMDYNDIKEEDYNDSPVSTFRFDEPVSFDDFPVFIFELRRLIETANDYFARLENSPFDVVAFIE